MTQFRTLPYAKPIALGHRRFSSISKYYRTMTAFQGQVHYSLRGFKRASEALEYGERLVARYIELTGGK